MKIDIHAHILPKSWPDLRERYGYGGFVRLEHTGPGCARMMKDDAFFRAVEGDLWDPPTRLVDCDRDSVDVQVLSTVPVMFSYWAQPRDTLDLCRILNDDLAETVSKYPKRFVGLGTLPMQAPRLAAQELERCMSIGLKGVEIGSHIGELNLDDRRLTPFYAAAEEQGAAIFVHPWDMMAMEKMPRYWLPWLVGMPAETSLAICSILMGGVLERHPKLRFAFAHGGGAFPGTIGRVMHGFNVRPDLCQTRTTTPPTEFFDKLTFDTLLHDPDALRYLIHKLGFERLALGTDYPFPLGEHVPGKMIEEMSDLSAQVKERLLSGTALAWLGLDRADFETEASEAHSQRLGAAAESGAIEAQEAST